MRAEQVHREYMQTMQEIRKLRILHRRKHEAFGHEFGFLRMIEEFQYDHPDVPGIYVSDLAACTGITKSGVSKSLNNLERRGMIRRTIDPNNRRNTFVSLTEEGHLFCMKQHKHWHTLIMQISEEMGEEHFLEVVAGVREIVQIMVRELTALDGQNNTTKETTQCDLFCDT
ncbi:MAG: MarR family transcriptional regulator [Eubacteriales bacterium]|nr:MarR family transcriptional regulator [Eubacteriales bacterium]